MVKPLSLTLFGSPHIVLADQEIIFSFSKMNALLFYLAIHKTSTRDEMANLLWPDKSEKDAKRNLRNTIYQVNKLLDGEYIKSLNNKLLQLNPDYPISCDVDAFLACPQQAFGLYKGPFLKNFYIKDSEEYDLWLLNQRASYEQTYLQERYRAIEGQIEQEEFAGLEQDLHYLISLDEFDERFYQLLMRYYRKTQRTTKVIDVYHQLSSLLESELGITPSKETRSLYEEALKAVQKQGTSPLVHQPNVFVGRHYELQFMETELQAFVTGRPYRSIHLEGRFGTGKQTLCSRVLADFSDKISLISIQGCPSNQAEPLLPWTSILNDLGFPLSQSRPTTSELLLFFQGLADQKKLVFLISNLQWLDSSSYDLLTLLLYHLGQKAYFLLTSRPLDQRKNWSALTDSKLKHQLVTLPLTNLSQTETNHLIQQVLENIPYSTDLQQVIYQRAQGNPFFTTEYCQLYKLSGHLEGSSKKMQEAFQHLLNTSSSDQKEILLYLPYFQNGSPLQVWSQLSQVSPEEMIVMVDDLLHQGLLTETEDEEPLYQFPLPALRDYLYTWHSTARKRLIHKQIAQLLEENPNHLFYPQIAYHYKQAKEDLKALAFRIQYLQTISMKEYELFPIYMKQDSKQDWPGQPAPIDLVAEFEELQAELKHLEADYRKDPNYQQLLMSFLLLEGKFYIRYEEYERGLDKIHRVIAQASDFGNAAYLFEGYKQLIYHCIQTNSTKQMDDYISKAMELAIASNNHEQIGISLRLQGLYELMTGQLKEAKRSFESSLTYFTVTEKMRTIYASNIAATYDYLAEVYRITRHPKQALSYQKKAIDCLAPHEQTANAAIFYTDFAIIHYSQENYRQAQTYFSKALDCFQQTSSTWRKAQLEAYLALDALRRQDYLALAHYFKHSKQPGYKLTNPRDRGIQYALKALVKYRLEQGNLDKELLLPLLSQKSSYYKRRATELLSPIRDCYELNLLEELTKE